MKREEFDKLINLINTKETVLIMANDEKCKVSYYMENIYVYEEGRLKPYIFDDIESFRIRFEVFSPYVIYVGVM